MLRLTRYVNLCLTTVTSRLKFHCSASDTNSAMHVGFVVDESMDADPAIYINPDNEDDAKSWVAMADVQWHFLQHGDAVLYKPQQRGNDWEATKITKDLSRLTCDPSRWYYGTIEGVKPHFFFIKPDMLEFKKVMCLPSVSDIVYGPFEDQRVVFRAGPSQKVTSKYLQAIRVTVQDMVDVESDAQPSCYREPGWDEDVTEENRALWATSEDESVGEPMAETIASDPVVESSAEFRPPWRRIGRHRVV